MERGLKEPSALRRKSDYIVSPYIPDTQGRMQPHIPSCCLQNDDGQACHLVSQSRRERKCGPGYPLLVVLCQVHHCSATLYPPGYSPYARLPVLNLSPDGTASSGETPERGLYSGTRLELKAPIEKRLVGTANSEQGAATKATWQQVSRRQVTFAAALFGLQAVEYRLVERMATVLALSLAVLKTAAEGLALARRGARRWEVVFGVREHLTRDADLLARLLEAGRLAGLWGRAFGVRAEAEMLYPLWSDNRS